MTQNWTNQKLFEQIVENLRKNDELPDILEYSEPAFDEVKVTSYEVACLGSLGFGGSEGIYVRVSLAGDTDLIPLGTFKTLRNDEESWDTMAQLMADFQWECTAFIEEHYGEFTEEEE